MYYTRRDFIACVRCMMLMVTSQWNKSEYETRTLKQLLTRYRWIFRATHSDMWNVVAHLQWCISSVDCVCALFWILIWVKCERERERKHSNEMEWEFYLILKPNFLVDRWKAEMFRSNYLFHDLIRIIFIAFKSIWTRITIWNIFPFAFNFRIRFDTLTILTSTLTMLTILKVGSPATYGNNGQWIRAFLSSRSQ